MSALTTKLLNLALDVATLEPVMEGVRHANAWRGRARKAIRDASQARLEHLGLATRVDLARIEDEIARTGEAVRALTEALERLADRGER